MIEKPFLAAWKAFLRERRGNAAVLVALTAIPMLSAAGFALDYAMAARTRSQLAAIADTAALAATTPAMMTQTASAAKTAAIQTFAAQATLIKGIAYNAGNLTPDVQDSTTSPKVRTATVTYTAQVTNMFGGFYHNRHTNISVTSTASRKTAPNIDFYLLLDNSPSMELPATTSGINAMVSVTGCAFACHESNFNDPELTPYPGWGSNDSYAYAQGAGITLRIDNVRTAAQNLAATAANVMSANGATYQLAAYGFNYQVTQLQNLTTTTTSHVTQIKQHIGQMTPPLMSDNSVLAGAQTYTYPTSSNSYNTVTVPGGQTLYVSDAMSDFSYAMSQMNGNIPNPGNGTNINGDKPQKVLMIVTDGVDDVSHLYSSQCSTTYNWNYTNTYGSFFRCQQPIDPSVCTTIKNRGIRIAVLYTTYFPVTSNWWYNNTVAPFISQVPTALQQCASSSNLYFEVNTDGDISAAMETLFRNAVSTAPNLTQ